MKIALSVTDKSLESKLSDVFGRCSYFAIFEVENEKIGKPEFIKNENIDQNSGAGISAAQLISKENVDVVITGNIGPRAIDVLKQFKIEIYYGEGIIKEVLQEFITKKLEKIN